jgi:hypothetical protein
MKYFGGILLVLYAGVHALGLDRFPDEERGTVPANVRRGPGGLLLWHTGFMGGK